MGEHDYEIMCKAYWVPENDTTPIKKEVACAVPKTISVKELSKLFAQLNERTPLGKLKRGKNEMLDSIKNVVFNDPATIVFWADGTKTIVKCEREDFDHEKGLAMAIVKKVMADNHGYYNEIFKKWLPKDEPVITEAVPCASKTASMRDHIDINKYFPKGRKGTDGYPTEKK